MSATTTSAIKAVRDTPADKFNKGCEAKYLDLGNGYGIKFYNYHEVRDRTHSLQKRAAGYQLAPGVGRKTTFKLGGDSVYGYITQSVKVIKDEYAKSIGATPEAVYRHPNYVNGSNYTSKIDGYDDLMRRLKEIGFGTCDMHWGNVGRLEDGRLVAIDFDLC